MLVTSGSKPGRATTRSFLSHQSPTRAAASSSNLDSSPEPPLSGQSSRAESRRLGIHKQQDHATPGKEQTLELKERCLEMLVERERELEEVKAKPGHATRTTSFPSQSSHRYPPPSTTKPFYLDPRILYLFKCLDSVSAKFESEPRIDLKSLTIDVLGSKPHTPTKMKMQKMVNWMVKEHSTIETMLKQRENYILAKEWVDGLKLGFELRRGTDPKESSELGKDVKMSSGETGNGNGENHNVEETATIWKKWESWDASHISHLLSEQKIYNFFKGRLVEVVTTRIQNATPSRLLWEDKQAQKYKIRRELMKEKLEQKKLESGGRRKKAKIVDRWRNNTIARGKESKVRQ